VQVNGQIKTKMCMPLLNYFCNLVVSLILPRKTILDYSWTIETDKVMQTKHKINEVAKKSPQQQLKVTQQ
jgi:hypothetical protein